MAILSATPSNGTNLHREQLAPNAISIAAQKFIVLCKDTRADSALFMHKGEIIAEYYAPDFKLPTPMMSCTKSIAGLAAFMLVERGKLDLDATVTSIMTEWEDWKSEPKSQITVRHLMTQTSALPGNKYFTEHNIENQFGVKDTAAMDDAAARLQVIPEYCPPGSHYDYSNPGTQILAAILTRAAQEPIQDFISREILNPLGMSESSLHIPDGHAGLPWLWGNMKSTPRDFVRIGQLFLYEGSWEGKQIVKKETLQKMLTCPSDIIPGVREDYAHLWWLDPKLKSVSAIGYLNTNLHIFPNQDLILVRTQKNPPIDDSFYQRMTEIIQSL